MASASSLPRGRRLALPLGLALSAALAHADTGTKVWSGDLRPIAAGDWNEARAAHLLEALLRGRFEPFPVFA